MSNPLDDKKEPGMYVGEVVLGVRELSKAVEAAERLLGHAYDEVSFDSPDHKSHEVMMGDIYAVAKMLIKVTSAVTGARLVAGASNEVH
jgi:hypothetical protein